LKALAILLLKVPEDMTVRSDISLWEQLENRPALSDSPLLAEKIKSNEPNHSYNPPHARKQLEKGEPVVQPPTLGIVVILRGRYSFWERESEKGMEVMGRG
jgi:hypothetical protein